MVVTIGVSISPREDQRHEIGLVVDQVEIAARSNRWAMCSASHTLGLRLWSSE